MRALVYVTALAPDEREAVADVFYRNPRTGGHPNPHPTTSAESGFPLKPLPKPSPSTRASENTRRSAQRPIAVACIQTPASEPG